MAALSGGKALAARLEQLSKKVSNAAELRVGFLEGATYPAGTSVAMVAAIQEFGAPSRSIPSRPYFRSMIAKESGHWGDDVAALLQANDFDADAALKLMGAEIAAELRESIVALTDPALSPVTLMLRKMKAENPDLVITGAIVGEAARRVASGESPSGASTKPLVDTGHLLNSIDYEIKS